MEGTGNRDGHAAVGPGSNTAKPEKERETKPPEPDGREEAGGGRDPLWRKLATTRPLLPQGLMPKPALKLWDSRGLREVAA